MTDTQIKPTKEKKTTVKKSAKKTVKKTPVKKTTKSNQKVIKEKKKRTRKPYVRKPIEEHKKSGPPKILIDYKTLQGLCTIFCTGEECSAILGMDYDTLNDRLKEDGHQGFSEYFRRHSSTGKMSLRRKQFSKAVNDGNVQMLIWLGKQNLGQMEFAKPKFEDLARQNLAESGQNDEPLTEDEVKKFNKWFNDQY